MSNRLRLFRVSISSYLNPLIENSGSASYFYPCRSKTKIYIPFILKTNIHTRATILSIDSIFIKYRINK